MMKARFLRYATLEELRTLVPANLASYRQGDFKQVEADSAWWFEHDVEVDETKLSSLLPPSGQNLHEPENCELVYVALDKLSPYEARDERLWAYLTHTTLLLYTRDRWPIPTDDDEAIAHIRKHFFARDKRQVERDNSGSRLWWMAHLCARVQSIDLEKALEALLFRSDVRASIIERPTSSQSTGVFGAILSRLMKSYTADKQLFERNTFRRFMREINSVGGYKLLDCMTEQQVDGTLNEIIVDRLEMVLL